MYEKEKIKSTLAVYFNFIRKEDIRNEVDNLMEKASNDEVMELLKDPKYITAAVKDKDLEMARILCANGSILPTSLFKIAIDNCDTNMLNFLLDTDIDINGLVCDKGEYYEPIAYLAIKYSEEFYKIAEKMLKLGANPNAKIGKYTIIEYYLRYCSYVFFYVEGGIDIVSLFIQNGAIFNDENVELSYYAAYKLNLIKFQDFTKGNYIIHFAIYGAIEGNKEETLEYILSSHTELIYFSLIHAIKKNATISILNTILYFNIPKYLLELEIKRLKSIKHRIGYHKYHQMLKMLKRAKRKAK